MAKQLEIRFGDLTTPDNNVPPETASAPRLTERTANPRKLPRPQPRDLARLGRERIAEVLKLLSS